MANLKEIRRRIRSIESTRQMTRAMERIASGRLQRARARAEQARPCMEALQQSAGRLLAALEPVRPPGGKRLLWVIAGDRGLAGGYHTAVLRLAQAQLNGETEVVPVGRKAQAYFEGRGVHSPAGDPGVSARMTAEDAHDMARPALAGYLAGEIGEISVCYTALVSPLVQQPRVLRLLPVPRPPRAADPGCGPSAGDVYRAVLETYLGGMLYGAAAEAYAAEQSARRLAMETASDNAGELLETLRQSYHRARQAAITQEITEISAASGAACGTRTRGFLE